MNATTMTQSPFREAVVASFKKLSPKHLCRNPTMFVTGIGAVLVTLDLMLPGGLQAGFGFTAQIAAWLWFTVLFANFAEALAEGRGKAQAKTLRGARKSVQARRRTASGWETVDAAVLRKNDVVEVVAGMAIPADGEVIEGAASVNESAVTGESAPVIREAGGDRSAVTGGTTVLSDRLLVRVSADPGEGFLDRMIALIEGAKRQKTPNEVALTLLLSALTLIFLLVVGTLPAMANFVGVAIPVVILVSLLVCLIPTTIGGLLSAIGIAGIDRLTRKNVLAMSGRAVEAAGDVDVLLLDKTGTITLGDRQAVALLPAQGKSVRDLGIAAWLASRVDGTPEGRSLVALCERDGHFLSGYSDEGVVEVPFTAQTRLSGIDTPSSRFRKGASSAVAGFVGKPLPEQVAQDVERISRDGGTPLVVAEDDQILGTVHLKDVVKAGLPDQFRRFRAMGIRTIMVTGDNPLTAQAIASEAGVDEFLAEAKPEDKLARIRQAQAEGHLVAMTGDGTNDAPALAQADVGIAMQSGTQAAKEAGNMVDLDSHPGKLLEVVEVGKQMLMTRGSLTTFSVANDVAKYFVILPALLAGSFPQIAVFDLMHLASPRSAILSAVVFNALVIVALIPLALKGVRFRPLPAASLLRRNLLIYGVGGLVAPFVGIKLIDLCLHALGAA